MPLMALSPQRARVVQRVQVTRDSNGNIIAKKRVGVPVEVPSSVLKKAAAAMEKDFIRLKAPHTRPLQPGAFVAANILVNRHAADRTRIPMGGQTSAVPVNTPFYAQGDFSYAQPGPVRIWKQDMIIPELERPAADAEGQFPEKTAGEELVDNISDKLYETTAGLVVAEELDEYAEEASFFDPRSGIAQRHSELGDGGAFSHNSEGIARWMQDNDRSSAGTTLMEDTMDEYGGDMGMKGFGMEGLDSYTMYKAAGKSKSVLIADVMLAANRASGGWKNLERITRDSVVSELSNMGYPAAEITASIDGIVAILPGNTGKKIRERFYARYRTTPAAGSQQAAGPSSGAGSTASAGFPVWAIPVAAIGAILLFNKFKS